MGPFDMAFDDVANGVVGAKKRPVATQPGSAISAPPSLASPNMIASPQAINMQSGGVSLGRSPAPTIHANGGLPAPVVQQWIDTMRGQLPPPVTAQPSIPPAAPSPLLQGVPAGIAQNTAVNPNPQVQSPLLGGVPNNQAQVQRNTNYADNSQAGLNARLASLQADNGGVNSATASMNNPAQAAALSDAQQKQGGIGIMGRVGQAFPGTTAALTESGKDTQAAFNNGNYGAAVGHAGRGALAGIVGIGDDVMRSAAKAIDPAANALKTFVTGSAEPASAQLATVNQLPVKAPVQNSAPQLGVSPNAQATANESDLTGRQGGYMVENNLRSFEDKGNGIVRTVGANGQRNFTNVGTENITDPTKQVQANSYDGAANNASLARANAIRQEMIDRQPQGGVSIMGDGGIEAANAEKTARWRQDDLLAEARRGNQAAVGAAINANASTANAATNAAANASAEAGRVGVATRGQDMQARNEAARLAGNPIENQLKQAQTQGIMATTDSAQMLADIQKKALAGDPQAMASYLALTGKKPNAATDRYMTVQGGEEIGPDGMTKIKRPSGVFDSQTQQFVSMDGGQQKQQQAAPASAIEYLKKNPAQSAAFKAKYGYLPEGV